MRCYRRNSYGVEGESAVMIAELLKKQKFPLINKENSSIKKFGGKTENSAIQQFSSDRARQYVAKIPAAVSGENGHSRTFSVAIALVHGFALSDAEAWPILMEYSARCQPPWSDKELRHKLESAAAASQTKPRGHLLAVGSRWRALSGSMRPEAKEEAPRSFGKVGMPGGVVTGPKKPEPPAAPVIFRAIPIEAPNDPVAAARRVPDGLCAHCWNHWGRALWPSSCICTGDVVHGRRKGETGNGKREGCSVKGEA